MCFRALVTVREKLYFFSVKQINAVSRSHHFSKLNSHALIKLIVSFTSLIASRHILKWRHLGGFLKMLLLVWLEFRSFSSADGHWDFTWCQASSEVLGWWTGTCPALRETGGEKGAFPFSLRHSVTHVLQALWKPEAGQRCRGPWWWRTGSVAVGTCQAEGPRVERHGCGKWVGSSDTRKRSISGEYSGGETVRI